MESPEEARQRAEQDYRRDQQSQMATEQSIRNAEVRNTYNSELSRQRQAEDKH